MTEILRAIKKYRFFIFAGLGIVFFLSVLDPVVELILKISEHENKTVVQTDPRWQRFTNFQCEFAVSFPSRPFLHPYPLTNSQYVISYRQFASVLGSNQVFMIASLQTSFTNDFSKDQIKYLMDKTMTGAMGTGDTLIYQQDITYGTNIGREFQFQRPNNDFVKVRYYRIGRYLQTLIVLEPPEDKDSTNISYFLNSFSPVQR